MKSFILCLALALCINIVVGRAVQKNDEKKHDEHYEEPDDVAVSDFFKNEFVKEFQFG